MISLLGEVGMKLGLAYQVRDDIIDIIGEPPLTGKPRAIDVFGRKMRLPVIYALSNLTANQIERFLTVWGGDVQVGETQLEEIIRMLEHSGSIKYCINKVRMFCSEVQMALEKLRTASHILADQLWEVASLISQFDGD
jgi:geranylgeranyl pyrophosphate synthase